jgi:hypothetical protein
MGQVIEKLATIEDRLDNIDELDTESLVIQWELAKPECTPKYSQDSKEFYECMLYNLDRDYYHCVSKENKKKEECYQLDEKRYNSIHKDIEDNYDFYTKQMNRKHVNQAINSKQGVTVHDSQEDVAKKVESVTTDVCNAKQYMTVDNFNLLRGITSTIKFSSCITTQLCPEEFLECVQKTNNYTSCMEHDILKKCYDRIEFDKIGALNNEFTSEERSEKK